MNCIVNQKWNQLEKPTLNKELLHQTVTTCLQNDPPLPRPEFEIILADSISANLEAFHDANETKRKLLEEPTEKQPNHCGAKRMRTQIYENAPDNPLSIKAIFNSKNPNCGSGPSSLENEFQPSNWDVICGRGRHACNHLGNRRYRIIIATKLPSYVLAKSCPARSDIVNSVLEQILEASPTAAGFVKKNSKGRWHKLGTSAAREKVAHTFRDFMTGPLRRYGYSSSEERQKKLREVQNEIIKSCTTSS